jgi:hypothetical protein
LYHVPDPPRRCPDKHAEWKRLDVRAGNLITHELVADLRAVAMDDAQSPAVASQLDYWSQTFPRMPELIRDRGSFAWRRERITAESDYCGARLTHV